MKKRTNLILLFLALFIAACNNSTITEDTLEGKVKREVVSLAPKSTGRIIEIKVSESQMVKAGDTLAIIDVPEVEAKLLQAEGAYMSAKYQLEMALNGATKEELDQVEAAYTVALEQFEFAEKSLNRIKNMYNDSLVAAQDYDEILTKYNAAQAQLDAATALRKQIIKGVREEELCMAKGQLTLAEGILLEAQIAYNERYIIAPKDMLIETIALNEGELATPGYTLFTGYDMSKIYFRFTVREALVNKFELTKEYDIVLPFENKTVHTKLNAVTQLASYANKTSAYPQYQIGEAVYELKLVPENIEDVKNLYDNYTAILQTY